MAEVRYRCPLCRGRQTIDDEYSLTSTGGTGERCPLCNGEGVVGWGVIQRMANLLRGNHIHHVIRHDAVGVAVYEERKS